MSDEEAKREDVWRDLARMEAELQDPDEETTRAFDREEVLAQARAVEAARRETPPPAPSTQPGHRPQGVPLPAGQGPAFRAPLGAPPARRPLGGAAIGARGPLGRPPPARSSSGGRPPSPTPTRPEAARPSRPEPRATPSPEPPELGASSPDEAPASGPPNLNRILDDIDADIAASPRRSRPQVAAIAPSPLEQREGTDAKPASSEIPPPIDHLFGDASSPDLEDESPPSLPRGPAPTSVGRPPVVLQPTPAPEKKTPRGSPEAEAALAALAAEGSEDRAASRAAYIAIAIGAVVVAGVIALLASLP